MSAAHGRPQRRQPATGVPQGRTAITSSHGEEAGKRGVISAAHGRPQRRQPATGVPQGRTAVTSSPGEEVGWRGVQ